MPDILPGELRLERDDLVAIVTIDRPTKLNTMTVAMDKAMNELMFELNQDETVRSVILTGAGDRAFSAGSDVNDLGEYGSNWEYRNRFDARKDYARAVWLCRKPIVAAINGYCIGGGLEMACASDIRIATPGSSFGAGEIRLGWHGGSGATQLLTHAIGPGNASRLLLTGDRVDAAEAYRMGLLQQIVEAAELLPTALTLASHIATLAPIAVQKTKHLVRLAQNVPLDVALLIENDSFAYCMTTEDAKEGMRAFGEGRSPQFQGR